MLERLFLHLFICLEETKERVVKILCDKSASAKLPKHVFDELAKCFLPDILAFYESPEGHEEYENQQVEQTRQTPQEDAEGVQTQTIMM